MTAPRFSVAASYSADRRAARQKVETLEMIVRQLNSQPTDEILWRRLAKEAERLSLLGNDMADLIRDVAKEAAPPAAGQTTLDMDV